MDVFFFFKFFVHLILCRVLQLLQYFSSFLNFHHFYSNLNRINIDFLFLNSNTYILFKILVEKYRIFSDKFRCIYFQNNTL